jgi:hypothetical protein
MRAKYAISFFKPVQGNVPAFPMPILVVAATIRVNSRGTIFVSEDIVCVVIISRICWAKDHWRVIQSAESQVPSCGLQLRVNNEI